MKSVIDVGSNSVLLLVEEKSPSGWVTLHESSWVTGVGAGVKTSRQITEPGWSLTLTALSDAFAEAKSMGCEDITAAGTMAFRIADNAGEFLAAAEAQGTPMIVLSGEQEAELGFRAVAEDPLFSNDDLLTIIDPGGHSTELMTAKRTNKGWETVLRRSFPIGALGLLEGSFSVESPGFRERLAAVVEIDGVIELEYRPQACGRAVVLGATGTNLISMLNEWADWQPNRVHGQELDFEEVSKSVAWLCDMTLEERGKIVGLEPGREKTIHAGALILERFLQAIHALNCTVSVRGWRHALLRR